MNENQTSICNRFTQPERQNRTYGYLLTVPSKRKKGCAVFECKQLIWEIQAIRITANPWCRETCSIHECQAGP